MIIAAGGEDGEGALGTTLQQIEERSRIIQEETAEEHEQAMRMVLANHEKIIAMVEIGLAGIIIVERTATEMIDRALRYAG